MNNKRKILVLIGIVLLCAISVYFIRNTSALSNDSKIHFIYVGDSNSALIESNGHYGLIDTGHPYDLYSKNTSRPSACVNYDMPDYNVNKNVVPYLQAMGVTSLDFVIITHAHSDHIGGVTKLIELGYINSDTVYYYKKFQGVTEKTANSNVGEPTDWCTSWVYNTTMNKVNQVYANNQDNLCDVTTKINKKDGTKQIVEPTCKGTEFDGTFNFYDYQIKLFNTESSVNTNNENNNSLGVLLTYGSGSNKTKTFISGDINNIDLDENRLLKEDVNGELKDIDVFMAGHHGYAKSTSVSYLRHINPANTILSNRNVTEHNDTFYGPNKLLRNHGKKVYLTYSNGAAIVAKMGEEQLINSASISDSSVSYSTNLTVFNHTSSAQKKSDWWYWYLGGDYVTEAGSPTSTYMYFDSNSNFYTGWHKIEGKWYYFDDDGVTLIGFHEIEGKTYYFATWNDKNDDSDNYQASMLTGWHKIRDVNNNYHKDWYYFDSEGVMQTGWKTLDSKKYYFDDAGRMLESTCRVIDNVYYCFDSSGVLASSEEMPEVLGDVVPDGVIDLTDVGRLYRGMKGIITLTEYERRVGDVVPDNVIDLSDVGRIYRYYKKIISTLDIKTS